MATGRGPRRGFHVHVDFFVPVPHPLDLLLVGFLVAILIILVSGMAR